MVQICKVIRLSASSPHLRSQVFSHFTSHILNLGLSLRQRCSTRTSLLHLSCPCPSGLGQKLFTTANRHALPLLHQCCVRVLPYRSCQKTARGLLSAPTFLRIRRSHGPREVFLRYTALLSRQQISPPVELVERALCTSLHNALVIRCGLVENNNLSPVPHYCSPAHLYSATRRQRCRLPLSQLPRRVVLYSTTLADPGVACPRLTTPLRHPTRRLTILH